LKPFDRLTPIGRARRLRLLGIEALKQFDLPIKSVRALDTSFNAVFKVDTHDNRRFALRVTAPIAGHTEANIRAELAWLAALAEQTDIPVATPLTSKKGGKMVMAQIDGVPEPRACALFKWIPGRDLAEVRTPKNMEEWGHLMARLHRHGASFELPADANAPLNDKVFHWPEPVVMFDPKMKELFSPEGTDRFLRAIDWIEGIIARLKTTHPMHLTHGDLHHWNVRVSRGQLVAIDFEDLLMGWPAQDIGTALLPLYDCPDFDQLLAFFRAGYERCSPWPDAEGDQVNAFIAARGIELINLTLQDGRPLEDDDVVERVRRHASRLEILLPGA